jgi:hypothetical protein
MKTINPLASTQLSGTSVKNNSFRRRPAARMADQAVMGNADITFVSQTSKGSVIRKGAGVMIGDYFVGVTTGSDLLFSHPLIVY